MFRSYRIGRVIGIPIEIDITFLLVLPVFAWIIGTQIELVVPALNAVFGGDIDAAALEGTVRPLAIGFLAAVGLFVCVALHEFGHSITAMAYDYEIESITLWLLGGIAQPAEAPTNWRHEFWIAVAGPIVSVAIGVVCAVVTLVVPAGWDATAFVLAYLALLNVGLAAFNMLPAFPLDGGRVLRALLARSRPYVRATRTAARIGKSFAIFLGLIGLLFLNVVWLAVAFFVYIAAAAESRQMLLDAAFDGISVVDVMTPVGELEEVGADVPLEQLLARMLRGQETAFLVVERRDPVGFITLEDASGTDIESVDEATVADVMQPLERFETIPPTDDAIDAFRTLGRGDDDVLVVADDNGQVLGVLTREGLSSAYRIVRQQALAEEPVA